MHQPVLNAPLIQLENVDFSWHAKASPSIRSGKLCIDRH